ncbi:class II aldolase/adducin family protein [Sphingomonas sp. UYEF23]|uniref:class II aldolase/adducin family protein n=1 Tax=Sphingomonas sp. UYEF23 TaxID=1756408 RepID=UPI003391144A
MTDRQIVADLVDANHILADKGIFDAFGHVSTRSGTDRFLLARNLAPAQVTAADIVEYDLDSEALEADAPRPYLERFIHGEIYRARPDVHGIVHSHAPSIIPFGVASTTRLQPICHTCGFLGVGAPVFEIRDHAGAASDMLIRNRTLARTLAESLGSAAVILMRGHGMTAVGSTVRIAAFRAIYTELNARLQLAALPLGPITFLTEQEAAAADAANEGQIDRPWSVWREAARAKTHPPH